MTAPWTGPDPAPALAGPPPAGSEPAGPQPEVVERRKRRWPAWLGPLVALGALLVKFGGVLFKIKAVGTLVTMLVSVAAYALFYGWRFAVGLVLLILVHEMGHVIALRRLGLPATAPIFLPFLGAFVGLKQPPRSAWEESVSGLAGPALGTVGAGAVALLAQATGSQFLQALAFTGFLINAFNLLPVLPLDGGRVAASLHPGLWLVGLLALTALTVLRPSAVLILIIVLGVVELLSRWRARRGEQGRAYYTLPARRRTLLAVAYVGLLAVLGVAAEATFVPRDL